MWDHKRFCADLSEVRLGLAGGIFCGLVALIMTIVAVSSDYGHEYMRTMEDMWPGYEVSYPGSLVAFIYGFVKGFVSLFVIAWLYNLLGCCCKSRCENGSCHVPTDQR